MAGNSNSGISLEFPIEIGQYKITWCKQPYFSIRKGILCIADNRIYHILAGALPMTNFDESVNSFVDDRIWEQIEQSNCHHCFAFSVLS